MRRTFGSLNRSAGSAWAAGAVYALLLVSTAVQSAFVPLAPIYARNLHASEAAIGVALAAATAPLVLGSFVLGTLSDRIDARYATAGAAALMAVGAAGQGLAPTFGALLVARLAFGLGNACIWTAGLAGLARIVPEPHRPRALSSTIPVSAVGGAIGPLVSGALADGAGIATPFLIMTAALMVAGAVTLAGPRSAAQVAEADSLRGALYTVRGDRIVVAATIVMTLSGLIASVANLLVPFQLHRNGVRPSAIGLALSASWVAFVAGSFAVSRAGGRARVLHGVIATVAMIAALAPVILSTRTLYVLVFLALRTLPWAVLSTVPYAFLGRTADSTLYGTAVGAATQIWAVATTVAPIVAGVLAGAFGPRAVYALLAAIAGGVAFAMAAARRSMLRGHRAALP